jgi:glycosyltransferase involved in cell wall biosynthesis
MRFSVMIPTCEPNRMLRETLASVLSQRSPDDSLEIAVVDDASSSVDVESLVASVPGSERIVIHRSDRRLGLAGNWNRAIALARGELVHLLHQDDRVDHGFYAAVDRGFRSDPGVGMAFCRTRIVDGLGRRLKTNSRLAWRPGILAGWLPTIAERQRVQTPSAVVSRAIYTSLGGFRDDLAQAVDWEMWVRIAAAAAVWYEPRTLATFRRHDASESARLMAAGVVWEDLARAITINSGVVPGPIRRAVMARSARWHASSALRTARAELARGDAARARRAIEGAALFLDLCRESRDAKDLDRRILRLRDQNAAPESRAA